MTNHEQKAREIAHAYDAKAVNRPGDVTAFLELIDAIAAALSQAVEAERERCLSFTMRPDIAGTNAAIKIRDAIRSTRTETGEQS